MAFPSWVQALGPYGALLVVALALALIALLLFGFLLFKWGAYWLLAFVSDAKISMASLVAMSLLKLDPASLISAKIMVRQAGLSTEDSEGGMSTNKMQAHVLAGGNLMRVVQAIIAAERAGIALDFDRAAAIDLAGRDVLLAVQTSILPRVIRCPLDLGSGNSRISAVAKNGVELLVTARITVRTNIECLIGGANEETIIARVGQGIITAIGTAQTHMEILANPSLISQTVAHRGLEDNTAYAIVSVDIADIAVGENIGARLLTLQADADSRVARANAEIRRTAAIALTQQNRALVKQREADRVLAEAVIPSAMSDAIQAGHIHSLSTYRPTPLLPCNTVAGSSYEPA